MALENKSTRMWPDENWIGINVVITDDDRPDLGTGEQTVISAVVKRQYVKGEDITYEVRVEIGKEAQKLIDDYKALRVRYKNSVYISKTDQIIGALKL